MRARGPWQTPGTPHHLSRTWSGAAPPPRVYAPAARVTSQERTSSKPGRSAATAWRACGQGLMRRAPTPRVPQESPRNEAFPSPCPRGRASPPFPPFPADRRRIADGAGPRSSRQSDSRRTRRGGLDCRPPDGGESERYRRHRGQARCCPGGREDADGDHYWIAKLQPSPQQLQTTCPRSSKRSTRLSLPTWSRPRRWRPLRQPRRSASTRRSSTIRPSPHSRRRCALVPSDVELPSP